MHIREPSCADGGPIAKVLVHTFLHAHRGQIPDEIWHWREREWSPEFVADIWDRMLGEMACGTRPRDSACVAEAASGLIIGIVKAEPTSGSANGLTGEVTALYVPLDYQGRGIGRLLLLAVAQDQAVKGVTALQVGTLITNTPARRFYEAMGGQMIAERDIEDGGYTLREVIYRWPDIHRVGQT